MQLKIPILTALIVLTTVIAIPLATRPVNASPGNGVDSPANIWYPYSKQTQFLRFQYYSIPDVEFTNFELGNIDVTDWELDIARYAAYDADAEIQLTPSQGQFGMFGVYWHMDSPTWTAWGCSWAFGTTACGEEMREGFTHLIDRQRWTADGILQGSAVGLAAPSPPAKDPPGSSIATQCAWDELHPVCIDAFNIAPDAGGFAGPGSLDFCAAADHMIAAGIATGKAAGTCVLTGVNAGVFATPMQWKIRNTEPRLSMGNGLMNAANQLFGANVIVPQYGGINVIGFPIVFSVPPVSPVNDWDMYTYGYGLGGPYPDHAFGLYRSEGADTLCGGPASGGFPDNAQLVCVPTLDTPILAATFTDDPTTFRTETLNWFNVFGDLAVDIPVFSASIRIASLSCVGGLVNQRGFSYTNFWTMLYGHDAGAGCAGHGGFGGGSSDTLRWGQASPITQLNWANVQTVWEFNVIGEVYDGLIATSPIEVANVFCWMCNTFTKSIDAEGDTHFLVTLRQNLRFHDGELVQADDIKFSYFNLRDYSANLGLGQLLLQSFTILSPTTMDIEYQGRSISHPLNLGAIILPRHLWELPGNLDYGDVGKADPAKIAVGYDPVAAGTLVGSGPFVCRSVFGADLGAIGTGCVTNSDNTRGGQSVGAGGTLLLERFDMTSEPGVVDPFYQYMRNSNPAWATGSGAAAQSGQFEEFSWADRFNNATVTIRDLAAVAACFGKSAADGACPDYAYWNKAAFHPGTPTVISSEVAIVASHLDDTWIYQFSWSGDQSSQPGTPLVQIVPFTP